MCAWDRYHYSAGKMLPSGPNQRVILKYMEFVVHWCIASKFHWTIYVINWL